MRPLTPSPLDGPPAGTTPDSCITTASASQCATPVGAAGVPSCRRRLRAYSPGHTVVGPSTPPLQTPAPPSHRRRFCPPPPRCTPPPPVCHHQHGLLWTNCLLRLPWSHHHSSLVWCPSPLQFEYSHLHSP
ncbi:hypothetical protein J4Q44_G00151260 [Coregonus suidteri]|uniref:Uncharacterized protein n=1 Tax=Coregonus suidteri TaxID=861788 RepID=A0AAN8LKA4_9TELE